MRSTLLATAIIIILLCGCKKENLPVNYSYTIAGNALNSDVASKIVGNAQTTYVSIASTSQPYFQLNLNGPSNQSVFIAWYQAPYSDSSAASLINKIGTRTFSLPAYPLTPFIISAGYTAAYGLSQYFTGNGNNTGGTVTITKNTGPGGVMSGTFYFNAVAAPNYPYDSVYVTQGTFTDVPIDTL